MWYVLLLLLPMCVMLLLLSVCRYGVGGLSVLNACAGCYSEDLPVIFISGVQQCGSRGMCRPCTAAMHAHRHSISAP
jgi:TPP-dependent 2-oxoacid decarboxylase